MNHPDQIDGAVIVKPKKDMVVSYAQSLRTELLAVIQQGEKRLIIDLQDVEMVDSTGLGVFISAQNTLKKHGGGLEVINVSDDILHLFKLMRLDKHFTVKSRGAH